MSRLQHVDGAHGGRFVNRPYNVEHTAVESVGAIRESPVQALANLYHVGCAYRRVRDAARYERVHMAGGKVAAPTNPNVWKRANIRVSFITHNHYTKNAEKAQYKLSFFDSLSPRSNPRGFLYVNNVYFYD